MSAPHRAYGPRGALYPAGFSTIRCPDVSGRTEPRGIRSTYQEGTLSRSLGLLRSATFMIAAARRGSTRSPAAEA